MIIALKNVTGHKSTTEKKEHYNADAIDVVKRYATVL